MANLLIVDDEPSMRQLLTLVFSRANHKVRAAENGRHALELLRKEKADLIISDVKMPDMGGIELLRAARELLPDVAVVMMTAFATVDTAREAFKLGADDFIQKPFDIEELKLIIEKALERLRLVEENRAFKLAQRERGQLDQIIGRSPKMQAVYQMIETVAEVPSTVLITGESGTGKELVANAVHRLSKRADGSFIDLNCAAFQESLLESELFGYEAGAFSGAKGRKLGLFELADNGTLFLDEVTELPAPLQSKLLRAIETQTFYRVGAVRKVQVNVRIIAATNRDMTQAVADGSFRADLLYRINGFQINLAPLRERPEDIEPLAVHLSKHLGGLNPPEITPEALAALTAYPWPGNVRQLRNCLERALLLANDERITTNELPPEIVNPTTAMTFAPNYAGATAAAGGASLSAEGANAVQQPPLREVERQQIVAALEQTNWHRGKTAEILGISPSTLYRRLRDYNLTRRG